MNDDEDTRQQQEYHEMQKLQQLVNQDVKDAIEHAQSLGLPQQEVHLIKWASGVR